MVEHTEKVNDITRYYNSARLLHREDGPAIYGETSLQWYRNGLLHREDGPASISRISKGIVYCSYYLNGELVNDQLTRGLLSARYESHGGIDQDPFLYIPGKSWGQEKQHIINKDDSHGKIFHR